MAPGSNWKRPWEDKGSEQIPRWHPLSTPVFTMHIPPPPPPPPPPLQPQLQQQSGMSSSASPDSRRLPPIPSGNPSPPASAATHSTERPPLKSETATEAARRPVSPYPNSAKRPRYSYEQSHGSRVSPNNEVPLAGAVLLQAVSSPVLEDGNKGPSALSGGAAYGPDLAEFGTGHCSSEPVPIEGNIMGGGTPQECEDCKQVRQVLKELATGFMELRRELLVSIPASSTFMNDHHEFHYGAFEV
ncbi:MAG: hypothetical protein M1839_001333 [Geoglossum umbratile]|nr:MAG: hypothetical protein M1839_001333 [Geoglossum umbratile]